MRVENPIEYLARNPSGKPAEMPVMMSMRIPIRKAGEKFIHIRGDTTG